MLSSNAQRTITLLEQLIRCKSVTPNDAGCIPLLEQLLKPLGFEFERLTAGPQDAPVTNLWAFRKSLHQNAENLPTLVFAGHTDVVPSGPEEQWSSPPFEPTIRDNRLYGRGASDMKGSIAAFIVALENFLNEQANVALNLALLITSDEEGPSVDGTAHVVRVLRQRAKPKLDFCIVGEPSAVSKTGDMIKNGRRGSLGAKLKIFGVQGHIAYPHLAQNPIHLAFPALHQLTQTVWDNGNEYFPPTSFQISNIHAGTGATNVIPGELIVDFNFRFSTESSAENLKTRVQTILDQYQLKYELQWTLLGEPFLTQKGLLTNAVEAAILAETGLHTEFSTSGGTSDGRFISQICPQVIEVGPPNDTIHKIDENIALSELAPLVGIYQKTLENLAQAS